MKKCYYKWEECLKMMVVCRKRKMIQLKKWNKLRGYQLYR